MNQHFNFSARPGMGKSSSMAYLAMKWVNDENKGQLNYVFNYHSIIILFPGLFLAIISFFETGRNKSVDFSHWRV